MSLHEIEHLFASVRTNYARASTYSDTGTVHWLSDGQDTTIAVFTTRFDRARRLISFDFSSDETGPISLHATGDDVQIKPDYFRAKTLRDAVATLAGVTLRVAHNALSMLLPGVIAGRAPCADGRRYRVKQAPSPGDNRWIVETEDEPREELVIGADGLLLAQTVRGTRAGSAVAESARLRGHTVSADIVVPDVVIQYQPAIT